MPNKPIISIDVNDQQFKAFFELFQQFKGQMGELPEEWKQVGQSAQESHEAMAGAAGAIVDSMLQAKNHAADLAQHLKGAVEAQKQFRLVTSEGETGLKRMGKEAKELADTLFGIGKFLFKLGAIGVGLDAGALFGIDRLAESAVGNQRQARGLGLTTGQFRAFGTDVANRGYSDEATLAKISDAKNDYVGRAYLAQATGLTMNEIMGTDAGTLAVRLAMKEHALWNSTAPEQRPTLAQLPYFQYLGQGTEQFQRNGAASPAELQSALANYQRDSRSLNISNRDTDALYAFSRQLTMAGQNMETYFTSKLAQLGPSLGSFITNFEKDAEILLNEVLTPDNLKKVGKGLEDVAHYLGSDDFRKTLQEGEKDVKIFLLALDGAAKFIAKLFPNAGIGNGDVPEDQKSILQKAWDFGKSFWRDTEEGDNIWKEWGLDKKAASAYMNDQKGRGIASSGSPADKFFHWFSNANGIGDDQLSGSSLDRSKVNAFFGRLEGAKGLPSGVLGALTMAESSYNPNAVSSMGAQGLLQLMPAVSRALGLTDPFNWRQSAMGGAELLSQLQSRYKGDIRKELAAWNWNPSSLDKTVSQFGSDWESHTPSETRAFIDKVMRLLAKSQVQGTKVTVINKPGTNVSVSTNAGSI